MSCPIDIHYVETNENMTRCGRQVYLSNNIGKKYSFASQGSKELGKMEYHFGLWRGQ